MAEIELTEDVPVSAAQKLVELSFPILHITEYGGEVTLHFLKIQ